MKKQKIIAVVGLCGSGKSVVCDFIENKGFKKIYFGGIVINEVKNRGLEVNEKNEKRIREELRKQFGMAAMAIKSKNLIDDYLSNNENVLIDGLYSMSEYKFLKNEYPNMIVIATFTPIKLRYERLAKRKIRPLTKEEARNRDLAEIDNLEKGGPIAIADYTIINDTTIDKLLIQVDKVFKQAINNNGSVLI